MVQGNRISLGASQTRRSYFVSQAALRRLTLTPTRAVFSCLKRMTLSLYRTALRAVLSDDLNCSSSLATRIQKEQPLIEAAEDKNSMHHKRVARKQVRHFVLVLCFNDHQ